MQRNLRFDLHLKYYSLVSTMKYPHEDQCEQAHPATKAMGQWEPVRQ